MEKIIGRGVLLLSTPSSLKVGYQISSEGIRLSALGDNTALQSLGQAFPDSPASVSGTGHLILNALPASPNDAFYDVSFTANDIGAASESFTLQVKESGAFSHGPQYHFSGLDLTFTYNENDGLSIAPGGTVAVHIYDGVFRDGVDLSLAAEWNQERDTLILTTPDTLQMDAIGALRNMVIEAGSAYDRWAQVQGLYAFDGGLPGSEAGAFAAHDFSGAGAPSLYFEGKNKPNPSYEAAWTPKGIEFTGGFMASLDHTSNPLVDAIQETGSFSVELWIKPTPPPSLEEQDPSWLFAIRGKKDKDDPETDNQKPYNFFLGQDTWSATANGPETNVRSKFQFPGTGTPLPPGRWETPLKSPAGSLEEELVHVIYSCSREGMQRTFINGVQVAQRFDPGYDNRWEGRLRIAVGGDIPSQHVYNGLPWKGEVHQLAIFNRALNAEEARLHYRPAIAISGDFSLDHVIPPLAGEAFPFRLNIDEQAASLAAGREVDLNIKPQLGFTNVHLECTKLKENPDWAFSGRFRTRFWEDLFDLIAHESGPANLKLASPIGQQSGTITIPGLGIAKYRDILLQAGDGDPQAWELSFGAHQEYGLASMVLENAIADYGYFRMGGPHLVLADPIRLEGKWLNEDMSFVSEGSGDSLVLKASTTFSIPFTLELPPEADPETGDAWGNPIIFTDEPMTISIDLELHKEGFLGVLNASFDYEGQTMHLPERRLYEAPASKMALLGQILEELKLQAGSMFARLRKHPEDYYLDTKAENLASPLTPPFIHLSSSQNAEATIESTLPLLFTSGTARNYANSVFVLSQTVETVNNPAVCTLTINAGNSSAATIRPAFEELVAMVEGEENGLTASGLRLLQNRIAERLPLEYKDLLYFHYGWDGEPQRNYIDLQPGMRLRVDFQNYQFVHATEQRAKSGFVGGGSIYIPIHSYTHGDGEQHLGFGPFLSRLHANNRGALASDGAGGLIDLVKTGMRKKFFRLFFPNETIPATAPERSVAVVGADTRQALPKELPVPVDNSGQLAHFFFRDKAMIIPEIQVFVGNKEVFVPVGTSVRQLIERYAHIPMPSEAAPNLSAFLGKARPRRLIHTGPDNTPAYRFLNPMSNSVANNQDIFDLPLIKGDRFYF